MSEKFVVWKYPIVVEHEFEIRMPGEATVLSVQMQGEQPTIWVLCDPSTRQKIRKFRLVGTGQPFNVPHGEDLFFIGTFQMLDGALVFHLFEKGVDAACEGEASE